MQGTLREVFHQQFQLRIDLVAVNRGHFLTLGESRRRDPCGYTDDQCVFFPSPRWERSGTTAWSQLSIPMWSSRLAEIALCHRPFHRNSFPHEPQSLPRGRSTACSADPLGSANPSPLLTQRNGRIAYQRPSSRPESTSTDRRPKSALDELISSIANTPKARGSPMQWPRRQP